MEELSFLRFIRKEKTVWRLKDDSVLIYYNEVSSYCSVLDAFTSTCVRIFCGRLFSPTQYTKEKDNLEAKQRPCMERDCNTFSSYCPTLTDIRHLCGRVLSPTHYTKQNDNLETL